MVLNRAPGPFENPRSDAGHPIWSATNLMAPSARSDRPRGNRPWRLSNFNSSANPTPARHVCLPATPGPHQATSRTRPAHQDRPAPAPCTTIVVAAALQLPIGAGDSTVTDTPSTAAGGLAGLGIAGWLGTMSPPHTARAYQVDLRQFTGWLAAQQISPDR